MWNNFNEFVGPHLLLSPENIASQSFQNKCSFYKTLPNCDVYSTKRGPFCDTLFTKHPSCFNET